MFFTYDRIARILFWACVSGLLAQILHVLCIASSCCSTFFTLWIVLAGTYLAKASLKIPPDGKAVLISGCDSGFGHAIAIHLHREGFRVFAGCLQANTGGEGAQKLKDIGSDRLHVLQLDVTRQEDINAAVKDISDILEGKEALWGVINNAGIATYGAVEWVSMAHYKKVAEVNLFGTIALTKGCLPLIRRAKGRVINVSSARGRMASPLGTTYETTKFGLEGFSDGLRQEMKPWGVDVCVIEPGNYVMGTSVYTDKRVSEIAEMLWRDMDEGVKEDYGGRVQFEKTLRFQEGICTSGFKDVSPVTEAMTDALTQRYPQGRYQPMGIYLFCLTFISQHLPEWVYDYICLEILMKKGW